MPGPLLFLILIGDIDKDGASAFLSSFTDDTRMGHGVNSLEDAANFQSDLKSVYHIRPSPLLRQNADLQGPRPLGYSVSSVSRYHFVDKLSCFYF